MFRFGVLLIFICILPWVSLTGLTFTKLVSRESRIEITNETEINLVLDLFEIQNSSFTRFYTMDDLNGGQFRIWSGRVYIGEPTDGCGLNNIDNGEFDPDRSILMLEFWKDDISKADYAHSNNCSLPKASIEARNKGWKNLMFSCTSDLCSIMYNLEWSLVNYYSQLNGTLIYVFYKNVYDALVLLNKEYEIHVRIEPIPTSGWFARQPAIIFLSWIFVFFGLLCFSFCIYKYVLYWRVKGWVINHTTISYYCNMLACISLIAFDLLFWFYLYSVTPYYPIWGCLAFGFTFLGSANFSLSMWWSGFLFPSHQKRFHSRIMLLVVITFFLGVAFVKFILERIRDSVANSTFSNVALVALFFVSIYSVVIGLIVTVKFVYSRPTEENAHIKKLKRSEAHQLMVLLLGTGFCVLALLVMSVIYPLIVPQRSLEDPWSYFVRFYFPAFFGLINVFLMTLLHNNTHRESRTMVNRTSSVIGISSANESSTSGYAYGR